MIELLRKLYRGKPLTAVEVRTAFEQIMTGATNPVQLGAFLALMSSRQPTVEELVGAAEAMRQFVVPVKASTDVIDTCGAGGAGSRLFNVSTTAAIVAAACGVTVAKHGNMAVTSRSGSADVLRELGVNISAPVELQERCLREIRIAFCYAPQHHPAMKHVVDARKALGFPTIFNLMGPLTNPAGARRQLVGVPSVELVPLVAAALHRLGAQRAMVACGRDSAASPMCELSTSGPTVMCLLESDEIKNVTLNPADVGLELTPSGEMEINSPAESAALIRRVLAGEKGPARDVVLLNTAAALWVGKAIKALPQGITRAAQAIDSGRAAAVLEQLGQITNSTATAP
jgi:anthranilate phosphoribosyltransferase